MGVCDGLLNVRECGAVGDGKRDDTRAIQKALDEAAERGVSVLIPGGVFCTSRLRLRSRTGLVGWPAWNYREFGGSILRLVDEGAPCLLDATGAIGATVSGLCLDGGNLGKETHGVMVEKMDYGKEEDTVLVERCRIARFSGDGVHLGRIWVFTVRHCMIGMNGGSGLRVRGWDGFVLDNWLSGNKGAGYLAEQENASVTMTGNRVEWNALGGIVICGGSHYNMTGNYIDRSGGPGMRMGPREKTPCRVICATGNVIYRSGAPHWRVLERYESCHVYADQVTGLTLMGNSMNAGQDDGGAAVAAVWDRVPGVVEQCDSWECDVGGGVVRIAGGPGRARGGGSGGG